MYKEIYAIVNLEKVEFSRIINSLKGRFREILSEDFGYFILVIFNYPDMKEIIKLECWVKDNKLMILLKINDLLVYPGFWIKTIINRIFNFKIIDEIERNEINENTGYYYFGKVIDLINTEKFIAEL